MKLISMSVLSVALACIATDVSQADPAENLEPQATKISLQRIKPMKPKTRSLPKSIMALHDYAGRLESRAKSGHRRMEIYRDSVKTYRSYLQTHNVSGNLQTIHNLAHKTDRLYRRIEVKAKGLRKKKDPTPEWWSHQEGMIKSLLKQIQKAEDKIEYEHGRIRMVRKPQKKRR